MNICIGGKNNIAVDVCKYIYDNYPGVNLFVIPNKNDHGTDTFQRSLRKYASNNGIREISLEDAYLIKDLVFLSLEFDRIIKPERFLSKSLYNIHFSLLPKYKGCFTGSLPILMGDRETGVTLHFMENGIDTGDIIDQVSFPILPDDTCKSLYLKLIRTGTDTVIRNLPRLLSNNFTSYPQPLKDSSYYSRSYIDFGNLSISLNQTAEQVDRQIRAYQFRDYQMPIVNGYPIRFVEFTNEKSKLKAGELIEEDEESIKVSTIDYNIILHKDNFDYLCSLLLQGNSKEFLKYPYTFAYIADQEKVHGWTLLMIAAYNNEEEVVDRLIDLGADINACNYNGTTVLMFAKDGAIIHNNLCVFQRLLELGADTTNKDYRGKSLYKYVEDDRSYIASQIKQMLR